MLRSHCLYGVFGILAFTAFVACGSGDEDEGTGGSSGSGGSAGAAGTGGSSGSGGSAGSAGDAGAGGAAGTGGEAGSAGAAGTAGTAGSAGQGSAGAAGGSGAAACADLEVNLHDADNWYVTLADMTEHETEPAAWDLQIGKTGAGPWITLGDGVEAINLGSTDAFVDVVQAPDTGYDPDPDLIGDTWKTGGAGETGFDMSDNVYVIHLADDTYAKVTVTSAKAGLIMLEAFHQADGSTDLACTM